MVGAVQDGRTPLHLAAYGPYGSCGQSNNYALGALLVAGADTEAEDKVSRDGM